MNNSKVAIIILAAGGSSRLGQPKQLLTIANKTLLEQAMETATDVAPDTVCVVLGSNATLIRATLGKYKTCILENKEWQEGIASSIRYGLDHLVSKNADLNAVLFMTCDQPFVSTEILSQMIEVYHTSTGKIVAASYGDSLGVPALFDRSFFPALTKLTNDTGAKKIILENMEQVVSIPFPAGMIDIDTYADYKALPGFES
jgi:molybdenum cofactor cytidylyltransferase